MGVIGSMDRRQHPRHEIAVEVDLNCDGTRTTGLKIRNISLSGVFLEPGGYAPPASGTTVELNFHTSAVQKDGRMLRARVVRVSDQGVGLVFRDFDLEDFHFIQDLIDGSGA